MTNLSLKEVLKQMENEKRQSKWAFPCARIGEEMDEISDFIANGDIEGRYTALLVFEEEYVNISKHAYPNGESGPLFVTVASSKKGTEMVFVDAGIPFDPTLYVVEKNEDNIGGHGIELIKEYSRSVKYKRLYGLNILRIVV